MAEGEQTDIKTDEKPGKTVMIAVDGSKHSIYALQWYVDHVHKESDNVIVSHCAELEKVPLEVYAGNPATVYELIERHEHKVKEVFKEVDDMLKKKKIKHTMKRLHEPPGPMIVKAADESHVDLIIAGSRGHSTLRRTIMGSVSDYLIHHSHVPVIICKHEDEHHKLK